MMETTTTITITTQVDKDKNGTVKKESTPNERRQCSLIGTNRKKKLTFQLIMASLFTNCPMIRPTTLHCNRIIRVKTK